MRPMLPFVVVAALAVATPAQAQDLARVSARYDVTDVMIPTTGRTWLTEDGIVKLIDVYPEDHPEDWGLAGYQFMVSYQVFRGRYREGFETPRPLAADSVLDYSWSLHTQNCTFRKGHRIMIQVQSTWFPLIDRNPQKFVPNIFEADDLDFRTAQVRVYRGPGQSSHVVAPVVRKPIS